MKLNFTRLLSFAVIALFFLMNNSLFAQGVTTAAIHGKVIDENGNALPSATIMAVHIPTGTKYGTTARVDGHYNILGLRVGGPYTINF